MTEKSKMTFATIAGLCLAVMIGLGAGWMAEHYPIFKRETPIAEETAPSSPPAMLARWRRDCVGDTKSEAQLTASCSKQRRRKAASLP